MCALLFMDGSEGFVSDVLINCINAYSLKCPSVYKQMQFVFFFVHIYFYVS